MCSMSVLCPLCAQTSFANIDALRVSLIKAANGPLSCPICHELFLGLDKLTIHLFSHTNVMAATMETAATNVASTKATREKAAAAPAAAAELKKSFEHTATGSAVSPTTITTTTNVPNSSTSQAKRLIKETRIKKLKQLENAVKINDILEPHMNSTQHNTELNTATSATSQQQQQSQSPPPPLPPPPQLSTCDICEFTFRNEQLRDMHFRLVHQNLSAAAVATTEISATCNSNTLSSVPDFKCHLCSKTFKMKGSLRVHLKVVHLMGLPYVNNSPKLSICDRIRHKEGGKVNCMRQSTTTPPPTAAAAAPAPPIPVLQQQQQQQQEQPQHVPITITSNSLHYNQQSTPTTNSFSFGTLTLLPTSNGNVLNINANGELVQSTTDIGASSLNSSNVLLVFNTNPATISPLGFEFNDKDLNNKSYIFDNSKVWECDVCSKSFTTKYFLKKHKRLHTGEMPYTCEICARTFTFQQSYHKHLLYHSNEKPHVCATCGRAFKELSTLHNHERIHSGEKPFKCEVCGKCFRQRVSFLVHTRIHTGVMPYKCELCQKSFRYKVSQRTHKCLLSTEDTETETTNLTNTNTNTNTNNEDATTVEEISENFIKAFLESTTAAAVAAAHESQNSPASAEIAAITNHHSPSTDCDGDLDTKTVLDEALLSQTIDDIVVESCNRMGIGSSSSSNNVNHHYTNGDSGVGSQHLSPVNNCNWSGQQFSDGSNSPTQKLQNMRLYSPQLMTSMDSGDGEFPRFLLDDDSNSLL